MTRKQRRTIDELYFQLYEPLFTYAQSTLQNESLAEEAVQETFVIACQKPVQLCDSPNPKGWLVQVLKKVIHEIQERVRIASQIVEDFQEIDADSIPGPKDSIDLRVLYGNVADTDEFKLMLAISQEGKSLLEIAEELDISLNACKKRAQRARETLQRRLK